MGRGNRDKRSFQKSETIGWDRKQSLRNYSLDIERKCPVPLTVSSHACLASAREYCPVADASDKVVMMIIMVMVLMTRLTA